MEFSATNWTDLFTFSLTPQEIFVRGSVVFWFLFAIFRFVMRRDVGAVGIGDFLFVVIVADASQNAMTGDSKTIADGLALVATLVFWNYTLDALSYRFASIRRMTEPPPLLLIQDGKMQHRKMQHRNMRREYITREEVEAKLRETGIENIAEVKTMFLESDGKISVISKKRKGHGAE
jgi:uncharacterized membrane protein YcaP (DUF421 family)